MLLVVAEEFVALVLVGGDVTVPRRVRESLSVEDKRAILMSSHLDLWSAFLAVFSASFNGISISLDIIPKPENMALRLFMSLWLIAPIMGAVRI